MNTNFETPDALRHDSTLLVDEAQNLLEATANVADEKVTEARRRLNVALVSAKECAVETYHCAEAKAKANLRQADLEIRSHPYQSLTVALGVGTFLGLLLSRRN